MDLNKFSKKSFDAISARGEIPKADASETKDSVSSLKAGDIVQFHLDETRGRKHGVFYVSALGASTEGSITLTVKREP